MLLSATIISLIVWIGLALGWHGFWRCDQRLDRKTDEPIDALWPSVTALIPARDESATITPVLKALCDQNYPGVLKIIVIDDHSSDNTADQVHKLMSKMEETDRLSLISAATLAPGWKGKVWALHCGLEHIKGQGEQTDWIWLTDADIVHGRKTLSRLITKAQNDNRDLVSIMAMLNQTIFWEKQLLPAFIFFFQMLYPFAAVQNPKSNIAGAAGGCIIVKCKALEQSGGFKALSSAMIDDCSLGSLVKKNGGRLWLGFDDETRSIRNSNGLSDLWQMVRRSAYAQLRYSASLLTGCILMMMLLFLVPPLAFFQGLIQGSTALAFTGFLAYAIMIGIYLPSLRLNNRSGWQSPGLPIVALAYTAMTLASAWDHWSGRGSQWKGRAYADPASRGFLAED